MSNQSIIDLLSPVLSRIATLDLTDAAAASVALTQEFPPGSDLFRDIAALGKDGMQQGWLCNKEAGGSRFSRVAKPEAAQGCSVDAVLLSGDGPWHKHVKGEVNLLLAVEGTPKFCGHEPGWAVFEPGSQHVPSVSGGTMLILYMLPEGAVEWKRS